jgi:ElaB/YqjD/DUF883 family membrane-anchored ribosome-binding protein
MDRTNNLQRAADDAKDNVAAAIETLKTQATETAGEIGRAARKTMHDAQGATQDALSDAASRAKTLHSELETHFPEQTLNTIIAAVIAGLLVSLLLLFLHSNRR